MTYRTFTNLRCDCGHSGQIVESENDQPYSTLWSSTSVVDLEKGGTYSGRNQLISKIKPSCPKCGLSLTPEHIVSQNA
jgi:hypothetical protein